MNTNLIKYTIRLKLHEILQNIINTKENYSTFIADKKSLIEKCDELFYQTRIL